MILPTISSIAREVLRATPLPLREGRRSLSVRPAGRWSASSSCPTPARANRRRGHPRSRSRPSARPWPSPWSSATARTSSRFALRARLHHGQHHRQRVHRGHRQDSPRRARRDRSSPLRRHLRAQRARALARVACRRRTPRTRQPAGAPDGPATRSERPSTASSPACASSPRSWRSSRSGAYFSTSPRQGAGALNWDFFTKLPKPVGGDRRRHGPRHRRHAHHPRDRLHPRASPSGSSAESTWPSSVAAPSPKWSASAPTVLTGVPSIVVGIFVYVLLVIPTKHFSALAGGVALSILMLPTVVRTTDELLRLVPDALREGALALGVPKWRATVSIVLRTAAPGIATGVMLAVARVAGETAPLLFTAFGNLGWSDGMRLAPPPRCRCRSSTTRCPRMRTGTGKPGRQRWCSSRWCSSSTPGGSVARP